MLSCVLVDYVILRLMCTKVYESWRGGILTHCCIGGLFPIPAGPFSFPSWLFPFSSLDGRGVKCEVTPYGLLIKGDETLCLQIEIVRVVH